MKKFLIFCSIFLYWSCATQSSKGQAVGFVTYFTKSGVIWKSWDLELNKSQTGMTSTAQELDFSVDNDNEDPLVVATLDSAQRYGWKVQIDYHQSFGSNCMMNRGSSFKFIDKVEVLDKSPIGGINNILSPPDSSIHGGTDTILIIIADDKKHIFKKQ